MRRAFTLVELLVVIAIIAVFAVILFPVFARAKESAHRVTCVANLHQLGTAFDLYAGDNEDKSPATAPATLFGGRYPLGLGWAGRTYPYVHSKAAFRCGSEGNGGGAAPELPGASPVSYAINLNITPRYTLSQSPSGASTVLLFEVEGSRPLLTDVDEGASQRPAAYRPMSAAGNGGQGALLDGSAAWHGPGDGRFTLYATGRMDNAPDFDASGDDYKGNEGRHNGGSNFLALDGHVVWSLPKAISAGMSARSASDAQRSTGCGFNPKFAVQPCAAGTADSAHRLTFSLN